MFIDGGDHVVVLGRYRGTMKNGGAARRAWEARAFTASLTT